MRPPESLFPFRFFGAMALTIVVATAVCHPGGLLAREGKSSSTTPGSVSSEKSSTRSAGQAKPDSHSNQHAPQSIDYASLLFVLTLSTVIGIGVIGRVSRLLHTPLMSLTNAISAIAVVGAILVTGGDHSLVIRLLGAVALFASMTNIVSGFLITDRMLKMFKQSGAEGKR